MELIAQHISRRAQSAAKAEVLAQQSCLTVSAAIAELRKIQRDQREMTQPRFEFGDAAVVRPQHAKRAIAADQPIGLSKETLCRNQYRYPIRDRRVVGDAHETVL